MAMHFSKNTSLISCQTDFSYSSYTYSLAAKLHIISELCKKITTFMQIKRNISIDLGYIDIFCIKVLAVLEKVCTFAAVNVDKNE